MFRCALASVKFWHRDSPALVNMFYCKDVVGEHVCWFMTAIGQSYSISAWADLTVQPPWVLTTSPLAMSFDAPLTEGKAYEMHRTNSCLYFFIHQSNWHALAYYNVNVCFSRLASISQRPMATPGSSRLCIISTQWAATNICPPSGL